MSDFSSSPGGQAQDEPASTSATAETEHLPGPAAHGGFGLPAHSLQSRGSSRGASPSPLSRAASREDEEDAAYLRGALHQSRLDMAAFMEHNSNTNLRLLESMTTLQDEHRRDLERFRLFSQNVQAPIIQAVTTSTETAQATSAMAGAVMDLRADLERTLYEAAEANRVAELQRMEAQQQALQSAQELTLAQDALARHCGEESFGRTSSFGGGSTIFIFNYCGGTTYRTAGGAEHRRRPSPSKTFNCK